MKKLIAVIALAFAPLTGMASSGGVELQQANIDLNNHAAIQRGAKLFVNYCMGCHSAKYVRYKLFTEVGLTEDDIKDNLMFTGGKIGDLMKIAMPEEDAGKWFGAPAPDLTLVARIRHGGADWIYSYLKGFYADPSRPMGVNNTVFPNVGMPHVLWELQGVQTPVYKFEVHHDGHSVASFDTEAAAAAYVAEHGQEYRAERVVEKLELSQAGSLTPAQYDQVSRDLATYLTYIAEPMKLERQRMGVWVVLFLIVFSVVAYLMKKEWWKDIH
ncbi:MAG: cytochrome c1 [Gammaproteobacteria bacterium]|nr:cytochrome c1 [Gammaproteobacteria bacterium]MCB1923958.1 cytochrome c1 [Gammaproteobacteria bacterium]